MSTFFDPLKPIALGADHEGFQYKTEIVKYLNRLGYQVADYGIYSISSVHSPDFAYSTAASVAAKEIACAVLTSGSANGAAISANKHPGIRAAICWRKEVAEIARKNNNANIICLPASFISLQNALDIIDTFLNTPFEGRGC